MSEYEVTARASKGRARAVTFISAFNAPFPPSGSRVDGAGIPPTTSRPRVIRTMGGPEGGSRNGRCRENREQTKADFD